MLINSKKKFVWPSLRFTIVKGNNEVAEVPVGARARLLAYERAGLLTIAGGTDAPLLPAAEPAPDKKPTPAPKGKKNKPTAAAKPPVVAPAAAPPPVRTGPKPSPGDELRGMRQESPPPAPETEEAELAALEKELAALDGAPAGASDASPGEGSSAEASGEATGTAPTPEA